MLAFSYEHLHFVPRSFASGKRSLGCFLVFWKVVLVKADSKSRTRSTHLLTQQGKGCISGSSLLGAALPGPAALGRLRGETEATNSGLPWPGTSGSAPTLQVSSSRVVVLEVLGKWWASCQLQVNLLMRGVLPWVSGVGKPQRRGRVSSLTLLLNTEEVRNCDQVSKEGVSVTNRVR